MKTKSPVKPLQDCKPSPREVVAQFDKSLEPEGIRDGHLRLESAVYRAMGLIELLAERAETKTDKSAGHETKLAASGMVLLGDTVSHELKKAFDLAFDDWSGRTRASQASVTLAQAVA